MAKRRILVALVAMIGVLGCVPKPAPPPAPAPPPVPAPVPVPPPLPPADWRDIPLTPGNWSYSSETLTASFGPSSAAPLFTIRCDRGRRQVVLSRPGLAEDIITVRTSSSQRSLPTPAALAANDGLLDEIAFSRGRFTVEAAGLPMLVIPAWAEPARVVEDCRS